MLLSAYYVPGTVVDTVSSAVSITKSLPLSSLHSSGIRPTVMIILSMEGMTCPVVVDVIKHQDKVTVSGGGVAI